MDYSIYTISNGVSNEIYIGITTRELKARMYQHVYDCELYSRQPFYQWLSRNKKDAKIELLEFVSVDDKSEIEILEKYWIEQFRQWGFSILNKVGLIGYKAYNRCFDEMIYDIRKDDGNIPYGIEWVKEWINHPMYPTSSKTTQQVLDKRDEIRYNYYNS